MGQPDVAQRRDRDRGLGLAAAVIRLRGHHPVPQLAATTIEIGAERAMPRDQDRVAWRAPELGHLPPPRISPARRAGLITLRAYLFLAAALVIVKVVQLAVS